jgi:hypothetical protein
MASEQVTVPQALRFFSTVDLPQKAVRGKRASCRPQHLRTVMLVGDLSHDDLSLPGVLGRSPIGSVSHLTGGH